MSITPIDPDLYHEQLDQKRAQFKQAFAVHDLPEPEVFTSEPLHYRLRAEFHIRHEGEELHYVMFQPGKPGIPVLVEDFPVAARSICELMPRLKTALKVAPLLRHKLFRVDFLATLSGEMLLTLVYHKPLDAAWEAAARELAGKLEVQLIGRSRGSKVVLERDWVLESFELNGRQLRYKQIEGSFTQPNGGVNRKMLAWACRQAENLGDDLLELYCGNGNFTIALAPLFHRVLATELSKSSVEAAQFNLEANRIGNVALGRVSSEEFCAAMDGVRPFRRLQHVDLGSYRFSTLFVDPPRSGLDDRTLSLARRFDHILYISCNPETLLQNVAALADTHRIRSAAVFDQFPYTHHLESGLLLIRR